MIRLEEMPPEDILEAIEKRSDDLAKKERLMADKKADLSALEAAEAIANRDSGMAMNEAEKRVRMTTEWLEAYKETQHAQIEYHKIKRDYDRALIAADLWRSQQANLRKI